MSNDPRVDIAVDESRRFHRKLERELMGGQVIMLGILGGMGYFEMSTRWMLVVGLFIGVGTISALIMKLALRLDAGRSYLELWAKDAERLLHQLLDYTIDTETSGGRALLEQWRRGPPNE